jgi:hypothetical protein
MKVHQITTCDEGITNPKRSTFGITFALRWGDVLHPLGSEGNWFKEPYFTKMLRFCLPMAAPVLCFVAWLIALVLLAVNVEWWALLALPAYLLIPGAFVSWNLFGWRGYLGAKFYGADAPEYKNWMAAEDVYEGSQAIQFSGRLKIGD